MEPQKSPPEYLSSLSKESLNYLADYGTKRKTVPVDVYTKQAFSYSTTSDDYALRYTIHLPPPKSSDESADIENYDFFYGGSYYEKQFLEGLNTATKTYLSKEYAEAHPNEVSSYDMTPFGSLETARRQARDAKRISDIKQLQTALELYNVDQDKPSYPVVKSPLVLNGCLSGDGFTAQCSKTSKVTVYMGTLPTTPAPGGTSYTYTSTSAFRGTPPSSIATVKIRTVVFGL